MDPSSGIPACFLCGLLHRYAGLLHNFSGAWVKGPLQYKMDDSLVTGFSAWLLGQPGILGSTVPGLRNRTFLVAKAIRKLPKSGTLKTILLLVFYSQGV